MDAKTQPQIDETVVELTRSVLKIQAEKLDLDANLIKDLNVDSLLALELIAKIEKTFRIEIPEDRVMELSTTRKLIEITRELAAAAA